MKALQRVAEEFESWGQQNKFSPEIERLVHVVLGFFLCTFADFTAESGALFPRFCIPCKE